MADIKISDLTTLTTPNIDVDYCLIWDASNSDTYNSNQRIVIRDLWDQDSDFQKLDASPSTEDSDMLLIYDESESGYRKISKGLLYSSPSTPSSKGYVSGGDLVSLRHTITNFIDFATMTISCATLASLTNYRREMSSILGDSNKGFYSGGYDNTITTLTLVDKITYATDTLTAAGGATPGAKRGGAGLSEQNTKGYDAGGFIGNVNIYRITYATELWATIASPLSNTRYYIKSLNTNNGYGYFGPSNLNGNIDKLTYATDTLVNVHLNQLTYREARYAYISQGTTHGYWLGGYDAAVRVFALKYVYATDTYALVGTAYLVTARCGSGSLSADASNGYIFGGSINNISGYTVNRYDIEHVDTVLDITSTYNAVIIIGATWEPGAIGTTGF